MKTNVDCLIYHIIYLLTLISLFFLNNDRTSSNEYTLNIILSFFTFIFLLIILFLIFSGAYKVNKKISIYIFACLLCVCMVFFFRYYIVVHWIYLLISLYVVLSKKQLSKSVLFVTILLSCGSIIYQLSIYRFFDGRPVLSYIDPNYSSYYIFCLFLFAWLSGYKKISILLIFCGFMTLSRNYFLAVIIFLLFNNLKVLKSFILYFNYTHILFIGYLFLLLFSLWFLSIFSDDVRIANNSTEKDITVVVDQSNLDRFAANILFIDDLYHNVKKYMWGINLDDYTNKVFRNSPHNSLLQLVLNYGIFFTVFYFLIFSYILKQYHRSIKFIPAYMSLLMYFLLLGGGIYGIQVIWLSFIYKASVKNMVS